MVSGPTVGIVANPASARDLRRLVARGSAVTAHQKVNILERVLCGLGRAEVTTAVIMIDNSGITAGLDRGRHRASAAGWPELVFVDQELTGTAADTQVATRHMVEMGVGAIVVLGGDGTHRVVAAECGSIPMVGISTGTNNAFPLPLEPTVAGLAAGLVATGRIDVDLATDHTKVIRVDYGDRSELALVDVAVLTSDRIGAGAIWDPAALAELHLCFARPDAIGLSAIGGHLHPVDRLEPWGLSIDMVVDGDRRHADPGALVRLRPPIGPGLFADITVASWHKLAPGEPHTVATACGVVAIDGERMFRFNHAPGDDRPVTLELTTDGPRMVDVAKAIDLAATAGILAEPPLRPGRTSPGVPPPPDPKQESNRPQSRRTPKKTAKTTPKNTPKKHTEEHNETER